MVQFGRPFTLTITYNDADWINAGLTDETDLNLAYWDTERGNWVAILPCSGCSQDTANNVITVVMDHLTEFALLGKPSFKLYLPLVARRQAETVGHRLSVRWTPTSTSP